MKDKAQDDGKWIPIRASIWSSVGLLTCLYLCLLLRNYVSIQKIRSVSYWYGEPFGSVLSYMVAPQVPGLRPAFAFSRFGPEDLC